MIKDVNYGASCFFKGFSLIQQPGLRMLVIIPLLLNLGLFILFFYLSGMLLSSLIEWFNSMLPNWLSGLASLLWLIYALFAVVIIVYGFVFVANLIGAPFYALLSERVQRQVTGSDIRRDVTLKSILAILPKALWRELVKLAYYLPRLALVLLIGVIPVVNIIAAFAWFTFSAWMMSIQYLDYAADNNEQSFTDLRKQLRRNRRAAMGFGVPALLASFTPILNLFAVPAAVCGATLLWLDQRGDSTRTE